MKSLKGTKTAENLMKSFAGECQARTDILIMQVLLRNKAMFRYQIFLWKQLNRKKNMQRDFINY